MRNKKLKSFYNKVYRKGEGKHYTKLVLDKKKITDEKIEILKEVSWKGKEVVDIGCGTGELAYCIAARGAKKVIGIDYSREAINIAKKEYQLKDLFYECKDFNKISGKFDVIVMAGVLEHIDNPYLFLKKAKRILNKKGFIIITCPNWSNARGYILLTLKELFGLRITLTDIHYFTPLEFEAWGKKLGMKLSWRTFEQDWGHGGKMIKDFEKRLPKLLKGSGKKEKIKKFIKWLKIHAPELEEDQKASGAVGLYHFKK
ncbi:class I SAM-dependent methyltransferase [Patescibacteria group bacterium]|nr:class I SAM-dependent methyltransferase [Patescibacteria group bacterium]